MATTEFVAGTPVLKEWLNDVNDSTYGPTAPTTTLRGQLADPTSASNGDAMLAVKRVATGSVATTQHEVNERTLCVFDFMTAAQIADVSAGTQLLDVTAACQAAHNYAKSQRVVYYPPGRYTTSAAITAYGGFYGSGSGTMFYPQGSHACFHFLPGTVNESWANSNSVAHFVGKFMIVFPGQSDTAGNSAHKGIWINKGVTSAANGSCDNVAFGNIFIRNAYNGIYQEFADKGNIWNCSFRDIIIIGPKDYGIYLDLSGNNGSLNVTFSNVAVDYNTAPSYGKGALLRSIANLSFDGILTSRLTSDGCIVNVSACTNVDMRVQQENNNMSVNGMRPTFFAGNTSVELALVINTPTVAPGVGNSVYYIYVDDSGAAFTLKQFQVLGETITNGSRKVLNAALGSGSTTKFTILDGTVTESDVVMSAAQLLKTYFPATNYALQNDKATLRKHLGRFDTTAGVAGALIDVAAYGGRAGKPYGLYVVNGLKNADNTIGFTDIILLTATFGAQTVVVISTNNTGATDARTYSISGSNLMVSIPTNVYRVGLTGFDAAGTWDTV